MKLIKKTDISPFTGVSFSPPATNACSELQHFKEQPSELTADVTSGTLYLFSLF